MNLKKAFTAVTVCVFAALLLNACEGASVKDFNNFYLRPAYEFEAGVDDIWKLNVEGTLYHSITSSGGWLLLPEYYGKGIGYVDYSMSINRVGLVEDDPERDFLYTEPYKGLYAIWELFARDGVDVKPIGPDTVTRIEYHPPDGDLNTAILSEEVENVVTDPEIIKAFFEDLFNPDNVVTEKKVPLVSDAGGFYLYSDEYPKFYVPDVWIQRAEGGRYFVIQCPFRWLTDYKDTFDVEISADVAEALIGPGTLE